MSNESVPADVANVEPAAGAGDSGAEQSAERAHAPMDLAGHARAVAGGRTLWLWPVVAVVGVAAAGHWWRLAGSVAATATLASVLASLAELRLGSGRLVPRALRVLVVVAGVTLLLLWQGSHPQ